MRAILVSLLLGIFTMSSHAATVERYTDPAMQDANLPFSTRSMSPILSPGSFRHAPPSGPMAWRLAVRWKSSAKRI